MTKENLIMFFAVIVTTNLCCVLYPGNVLATSALLGKTVLVRASYYGGHDGFDGQTTANCTVFDDTAKTAAHKTLPFGTQVILKNPKTGNTKVVTITDRGPYIKGRDIDVAMYGVGIPLNVANRTLLEMEIIFVPKKPIMGSACVKERTKHYKK